MIKQISLWAGSIVVAVIIVTILEMILPENKNKKYIKMVMSIYILFTIMSPIVQNIRNKGVDFSGIFMIDIKRLETKSIETNAGVINVYLANIKEDIKTKVEEKGYKVINIDVTAENSNSENLGKIYAISMELEKEIKHNNTIKIEISFNNKKMDNKLSYEEEKKIKEFISGTYGVDENKINIT